MVSTASLVSSVPAAEMAGTYPHGASQTRLHLHRPERVILFTPIFGSDTVPASAPKQYSTRQAEWWSCARAEEDRSQSTAPSSRAPATVQTGSVPTQPGARVRVKTSYSTGGASLAGKTGVVNGGPRLLSGGNPDIAAYAEGFVFPEFYHRFGVRRNPRTLAGMKQGGDLLLVAVDGRRPGYSVGASFKEEAAIMDSLGAQEAVNLDGGGSTTMTLGNKLVTSPSDPTGERPIGDAVVLLR